MDFIFEDDKPEVGNEIEAFCPKCGALSHNVLTVYEGEIRRVQCNVCSDIHPYRRPRGEVEEDGTEPLRRRASQKQGWPDTAAQTSERHLQRATLFSLAQTYREGDIVTHPAFGLGFVTEIIENKVEVTFQNERKLLAHGRPDLAEKIPDRLTATEKARHHAEAIREAWMQGGRTAPAVDEILARLQRAIDAKLAKEQGLDPKVEAAKAKKAAAGQAALAKTAAKAATKEANAKSSAAKPAKGVAPPAKNAVAASNGKHKPVPAKVGKPSVEAKGAKVAKAAVGKTVPVPAKGKVAVGKGKAAKTTAKGVPAKSASKSKPPAKPAKSGAKSAPKAGAAKGKPVAKGAAKPATKVAGKPAAKPTAKGKAPAQPAAKTVKKAAATKRAQPKRR